MNSDSMIVVFNKDFHFQNYSLEVEAKNLIITVVDFATTKSRTQSKSTIISIPMLFIA